MEDGFHPIVVHEILVINNPFDKFRIHIMELLLESWSDHFSCIRKAITQSAASTNSTTCSVPTSILSLLLLMLYFMVLTIACAKLLIIALRLVLSCYSVMCIPLWIKCKRSWTNNNRPCTVTTCTCRHANGASWRCNRIPMWLRNLWFLIQFLVFYQWRWSSPLLDPSQSTTHILPTIYDRQQPTTEQNQLQYNIVDYARRHRLVQYHS
jgi:hypothetical protein